MGCKKSTFRTFPQVVVSQYDQNEYKLKSYRITFLESPVTLMYNFQPSIGWMIDQEATDKHVRSVVYSTEYYRIIMYHM